MPFNSCAWEFAVINGYHPTGKISFKSVNNQWFERATPVDLTKPLLPQLTAGIV